MYSLFLSPEDDPNSCRVNIHRLKIKMDSVHFESNTNNQFIFHFISQSEPKVYILFTRIESHHMQKASRTKIQSESEAEIC